MWLLDVNLPQGPLRLLTDLGIACDSTIRRGWRELTNGELASAAIASGFEVILTRDREFGIAPSSVGPQWPQLAIVVITIPQARESAYLEVFEAHWRRSGIVPTPGTIIEWP